MNIYASKLLSLLGVIGTVALLNIAPAQAQTPNPDATPSATGKEPPFTLVDTQSAFDRSLLFSEEELKQIEYAFGGFVMSLDGSEGSNAPPPVRILKLAGISYKSDNNWVIWLNDNRLTPNHLLSEIVEIRVKKDRVHLKWFDAVLRDVINITMKPHHTYDIQSGIMLPGSH